MPGRNEQKSQQLERQIKVRQVTNIQASWTEQERGEEGKFTPYAPGSLEHDRQPVDGHSPSRPPDPVPP